MDKGNPAASRSVARDGCGLIDAETIFRNVRETYAAAGSYCDRGRILISVGGAAPELRGLFRTAFVRSRGLRFEFLLTSGRGMTVNWSAIRTDKGKCIEVRGLKGPTGSIGRTIARMTKSTFGAAQAVSRMLLPNEIPGRMLCAVPAADTRLVGSEVIGGDICFVVESKESAQLRQLIAIRSTDFLVRRVVYSTDVTPDLGKSGRPRRIHVSKSGKWIQTTAYEPEIRGEATGLELDW